MELQTDRLLLRQWRADDLLGFAELNADIEVMEFFPATLTAQESNALADRFAALISAQGWGFWAVELLSHKSFIGFVGLHQPSYDLPVSACTEIGWRLAKDYWGNGYATEAAKAAMDFAFSELQLAQLYSFTAVTNLRSQALMQRLGMVDTRSNFGHPLIAASDPLYQHVLYKIERPA